MCSDLVNLKFKSEVNCVIIEEASQSHCYVVALVRVVGCSIIFLLRFISNTNNSMQCSQGDLISTKSPKPILPLNVHTHAYYTIKV